MPGLRRASSLVAPAAYELSTPRRASLRVPASAPASCASHDGLLLSLAPTVCEHPSGRPLACSPARLLSSAPHERRDATLRADRHRASLPPLHPRRRRAPVRGVLHV